jgi:hypothetical protein
LACRRDRRYDPANDRMIIMADELLGQPFDAWSFPLSGTLA